MSDLIGFLRKKQDEDRTRPAIVAKIKKGWLDSIHKLYSEIDEWLAEEQDEGLIKITEEETAISEERLGTYKAPVLILKAGTNVVKLLPIGKTIIGADGRIDMKSDKGFAFMFLYLQPEGCWVHGHGPRPKDFSKLTKARFEELLKKSLE